MKLLLDAGLPYLTLGLLQQRGHDVTHANTIQLGATDEFLIDLAIAEDRVIITMDADFHAILADRAATTPSVIRLRIQTLRHEEAADLIERIILLCESHLKAGAVVSANRQKIRVRALPLR